MTHPVNHNLVVPRAIENQIRIGMSYQASQPALAGESTRVGMKQQEGDNLLKAHLHMARAQWRFLREIGQGVIDLAAARGV
jgi:hypothetical protein